jgi:hypothetical protein
LGRLGRPGGPGFGLLTDREIHRALEQLGLAPRPVDLAAGLDDPLADRTLLVTFSAHATPWMARWHHRLLLRVPRLGHAVVLHREGARIICRDPSWLHGGRRVLAGGELAAIGAAPRLWAVSVATQVIGGDGPAEG